VLGLVCRMSVEEMVEMGRQTTPPESRLKKISSQPIDFSHEEGGGPSLFGGGQAPGGGLELVWGPIHASETLKAGAHAAVCSLVVRLQLPASLHERLEQEVLSHTRPFDGDTALSLQERLGKGTFYDDFRAMVGGKHGRAKYVYIGVRAVGRGYGAAAARDEMRVERGAAATAATAGREEVEGGGAAAGARTGGGPGRARAATMRRRSLS